MRCHIAPAVVVFSHDKQKLFLLSRQPGIHAREWISPAVATYVIQQLVEFPENDRLLANVDWYIMPVMNKFKLIKV